MKLSTFSVLAMLAAALGKGVYAASSDKNQVDKTGNVRSLRLSSMSPAETKKSKHKIYEHVLLEEVQVTLLGPDDYSSPGSEEISFLLECLASSFDEAESGTGYEAGFSALEYIDEERRRLKVEPPAGRDLGKMENERELWWNSYLWAILFSFHCEFCPTENDDDWNHYRGRKLADLIHAERALSHDGIIWEKRFCTKLQEGPYRIFHSVETCHFAIEKIPLPGIHA